MDMFWVGLIVGYVFSSFVLFVVFALCAAAKDDRDR